MYHILKKKTHNVLKMLGVNGSSATAELPKAKKQFLLTSTYSALLENSNGKKINSINLLQTVTVQCGIFRAIKEESVHGLERYKCGIMADNIPGRHKISLLVHMRTYNFIKSNIARFEVGAEQRSQEWVNTFIYYAPIYCHLRNDLRLPHSNLQSRFFAVKYHILRTHCFKYRLLRMTTPSSMAASRYKYNT